MNDDTTNTRVEPHRAQRTNIPEVVFARFKDDSSLIKAVEDLLNGEGRVLVTKALVKQQELLKENYTDRVRVCDSVSGTMVISDEPMAKPDKPEGTIAILAAGTSDYFVAEEAALSGEFLKLNVIRHYDCGVAGIHRVKEACTVIEDNPVDCVIVVAGMEGALPSVIAGAIKQPVIAVPTSVGYGASFEGLAALLSMLNVCSPGISVVNIDNGFGAAAYAYKTIKWLTGPGKGEQGGRT